MESACRLCCRQEHDLINLFYPSSDANSRLRFMIFLATGVEINEADVSKLICYQCCEVVIKLYKYRDHTSKCDKAFKEECGQLYIAPPTNVQEVLRAEAEYVKELFPLSDQFSNVLNTNKRKKNDVEYKHSSVVKLYKEYKNIILPSSIFKQNMSPTVTLMSSEVTHWLEEQEKMKMKTSHLNSTFNILSDSLKETIVNSVLTPVNVNNIFTTSGNMEKLKHISISKQIIQPDKTLESYNFCVHCKQWFSTGSETEDRAKLRFTCKSCKMKLESSENLEKHKEDHCHRSLSEDLESSNKIITETIVEKCLESKNNYNQTKPVNTPVSLSSRTTTEYVFGSVLDERNTSIVANTTLSSASTTLVAKTTHHSPNIVANTFSLSSTPITFVRQTPTITPASRKQLSNVTNGLPRLIKYSCPTQTNSLPQPNLQNPNNVIFSLNNTRHFLSDTSKASLRNPTLASNFHILNENLRQSSHKVIPLLTAIKASVSTKESSNSSNNNNGLSTESSKVTATIKDSNVQSVNWFERCTTATTNTTINQGTQTTSNSPSIIANTPPHLSSISTTFSRQTTNRSLQIIRTTSPLFSKSTTFARQTTNRSARRITNRSSISTAFARQTINRLPHIIVTTSPLSSTSTTHRPPPIIATTSPLSSISTTFDRQSTNRASYKIATTSLLSSTSLTRQITDRLQTIMITTSSLSPTSTTFATQTTHCPPSIIASTSSLSSTPTTSSLSSTSSTLVIQNAHRPSSTIATTLSSTSTTFVRQTPTITASSQKQLSYFKDGMHRSKVYCDSNQTNKLPQDFLSNTSKFSENPALPSNFHTPRQSSHKVILALTKESSSLSNNNSSLSTQSSKVANSSIRVKKLCELN